jgi:predicted transcriptional regulator
MPKLLTTREVAKRLGISAAALSRYVSRKKVFEPETVEIGHLRVHSWTEKDVERLRTLLPKIANGRKTRHKKQPTEKKGK